MSGRPLERMFFLQLVNGDDLRLWWMIPCDIRKQNWKTKRRNSLLLCKKIDSHPVLPVL
jgi:hypothetical protein